LKPDALEENPRAVTILTVPDGGELELADSTHPVTLYHLATSHAADMLLTHETSTNTVFVVDIFSPGNATQLDEPAFVAALAAHGVPAVDLKAAGGHGTAFITYPPAPVQQP
jgi:hypothetical protein